MEATMVNTQAASAAVNTATNAAQGFDIEKFERDTGAKIVVSTAAASGAVDFDKLIGAAAVADLASDVNGLAADYRMFKHNEQIAVATNKKALYALIGRCYGKYLQIKQQSEKEQKRLELQLDGYMLDNGIDTAGKTMMLSKLLMCVFVGADAKKINSYYAVMVYAEKHNCKANNFVDFVFANGGMQAIRLAGAADKKTTSTKTVALTREQKISAAAVALSEATVDVFASDALAQAVQATANDKLFLIVTQLAGGRYEINGAVADASVVNAAMLAYYSTNKVQLANDKQTETFADEQAKQAAQIEAAAATAVPAI